MRKISACRLQTTINDVTFASISECAKIYPVVLTRAASMRLKRARRRSSVSGGSLPPWNHAKYATLILCIYVEHKHFLLRCTPIQRRTQLTLLRYRVCMRRALTVDKPNTAICRLAECTFNADESEHEDARHPQPELIHHHFRAFFRCSDAAFQVNCTLHSSMAIEFTTLPCAVRKLSAPPLGITVSTAPCARTSQRRLYFPRPVR